MHAGYQQGRAGWPACRVCCEAYGHCINRVPGAHQGDSLCRPVYTLGLNSDAGYAVLPLTLLGAPVSIGRACI
jgi:hypothetical protein